MKRLISLLAIVVLFVIAGCSPFGKASETASGKASGKASGESEYTLSFSSGGHNNSLNDFDNGLTFDAVVDTKSAEGTRHIFIAMINTKGEILYKLDTGITQINPSDNVFLDIIGIGKNIAGIKCNDVYYVISTSGKEIMNSAGGKFDQILAVNDEVALVCKSNDNGSSQRQEIGTIDSNGNWALPMREIDFDKTILFARWLGGDFFELKSESDPGLSSRYIIVFNSRDGVFSDVIKIKEDLSTDTLITDFTGNVAYYLPYEYSFSTAKAEVLGVIRYQNGTFTTKRLFDSDQPIPHNLNYYSIKGDSVFFKGEIDGKRGKYLYSATPDASGKIKLSCYSDYPYSDGDSDAEIAHFSHYGKYTFVDLSGTDYYLAVLDENMKTMFEPKLVGTYSGFESFDNGKVIYIDSTATEEKHVIIDLKGNVLNEFRTDGFVRSFHNGIAVLVSEENEPKYINENGEVIFEKLVDKSR